MKIVLFLSVYLLSVSAIPSEHKIPAAAPEYVDALLAEGRYDEFNFLMGIENPELTNSNEAEELSREPMFNKDLKEGDILLPAQQWEQARQGLDFERHKNLKWEGRVTVPYVISSTYNRTERTKILRAIGMWKANVDCVVYTPHKQSEKDYVFIFPGTGCYSRLGRIGGQQPLSLNQENCLEDRIITHELMHTIGFGHEHNRHDRDKYIKILWDNIPEGLKGMYKKDDKKDYGIQGPYDYYSIMHYPFLLQSNNKPAFEVLSKGIDLQRIGNGNSLTQEDIEKINKQYC